MLEELNNGWCLINQENSSSMEPQQGHMLKHRNITLQRIQNFIAHNGFEDVNLLSKLYKYRSNEGIIELKYYSVPDLKRITYQEATKAEFKPAKLGDYFGPAWSTHWFRVEILIPASVEDQKVEFLWNSNSEALIWREGFPVQGLTGGNGEGQRLEYILSECAKAQEKIVLFVEMACNGLFGPNADRFQLESAELCIRNKQAWDFFHDFQVIANIAKELGEDCLRGCQALYAANAMINIFDRNNESSISKAIAIGRNFLKHTNGSSQHEVTAIGHCHIDTAWQWPYDETKRKCARSFSTQILLMKQYPEHKFACSQAQQYKWIESYYPELFEEIKKFVNRGQFIPVGGSWVEMDTNLPSGESLVRQFLYGQKFFESRFGKRCEIFWLPDTFGYAAQLPQLMKLAGMKYFLSQKLSWNNINKFPHTSFYWKGLDGTEVLAHFPPTDTYNATVMPKELLDGIKRHKDKERSNSSLLLYGFGDGGGGPHPDMLERLRRVSDLDGLPRVHIGDPNDFFFQLERSSCDLLQWKGELYFEFHRGTYTSQARNKLNNRRAEIALKELELLFSLLETIQPENYPKADIDLLWELVLLNQFHDVLPGSSIDLVYKDSELHYQSIFEKYENLKERACTQLFGPAKFCHDLYAFNPSSWNRSEIVRFQDDLSKEHLKIVLSVPSFGLAKCISNLPDNISPALVEITSDTVILKNGLIKAKFDLHGRLIGFFDIEAGREVTMHGMRSNVFKLFDDVPIYWDAWDVEIYHLEKWKEAQMPGTLTIVENSSISVSVLVVHQISDTSVLRQTIRLNALSKRLDFDSEIDWNENRQILKVEFLVDIVADYATYETQFGLIQRPTHFNTSWDMAKFEVCAHKFADISEHGYGLAVLNDSKYGYSIHGNSITLSLFRAPKSPDPHCDIGKHRFKYALFPHKGDLQAGRVIQEAANFNIPLIINPRSDMIPALKMNQSYFSIDQPNIIVESIKMAEQGNDALILRLYEAYGARNYCTISSILPFVRATECNLMEDDLSHLDWKDGSCTVYFHPFKILSLKFHFKQKTIDSFYKKA